MIRKYGCWLIAAGVLAADRVTKALSDRIPPEGIPLIPGVIGLRYTRNTGAAFSMLSGHPWLLGVLSLAVIAAAFLVLRKKKLPPLMMTGLMMMLGGAASNMIDRFATGYVPDMIEFLFVDFAIFNVADTFLCIGCALTAVSLLQSESKGRKQSS
ncbi:MAG: signal peptidase II [Clostridia bacterium]|nr:signal peptidase II [Clostridia bacterium]